MGDDQDGTYEAWVVVEDGDVISTEHGPARPPRRFYFERHLGGQLASRIEFRAVDGRVGPTRRMDIAREGDFLSADDAVFELGMQGYRALTVTALNPDTGEPLDFWASGEVSPAGWRRAAKAASAAQKAVRSGGRGRPRTSRPKIEECARLYLEADEGTRLEAVMEGQGISRAQASRRIRQARDLGLLPSITRKKG